MTISRRGAARADDDDEVVIEINWREKMANCFR
jgi:hypothetical protein